MAGPSLQRVLSLQPLLLASLVLLLVPQSPAAQEQGPASLIRRVNNDLKQAWNSEPELASRPYPMVRLLPPGTSVAQACNPAAKAGPRRPAPTASYCPTGQVVLIDQDLLPEATPGSQAKQQAVLAYWIATGLAESLRTAPETASAPLALSTLEANCLAGVLLGASPLREAFGDAAPLLSAARAAYGDRYRTLVGSPSQRGYAVLTGLGATATTSCNGAAMAALATGAVPDPSLLERIEQLPPPDRAHSSLLGAFNSQCRPLPNRPCPRKIASSR